MWRRCSGSDSSLINSSNSSDAGGGSMSNTKVALHVRVAYYTSWGQHVAVVGNTAELGHWKTTPQEQQQQQRGSLLTCRHAGEDLIWEGTLVVDVASELVQREGLKYRYDVVEEGGRLVKEEAEVARCISPQLLRASTRFHLNDTWRYAASPSSILRRSAFANVLLRRSNGHREQHGESGLQMQQWGALMQ